MTVTYVSEHLLTMSPVQTNVKAWGNAPREPSKDTDARARTSGLPLRSAVRLASPAEPSNK